MSSGGSIQAMITAMKNNAALKKSRLKFKGLDSGSSYYNGKIKEKRFTPQQVQAVKDAYQLEVKTARRKTIATFIITVILVPIFLYGLIQLYLFMFV
ncbi:MAG: hypothetical protein ABF274_06140 [Nonlabens sp.]|uniref:hypothetical protein n=1 Tax=Nonlabens sp. TaxID=1888209 RepID=UPI00321A2BD4